MGTTAMRGHVEVDPIVGLRGWRRCCRCAREYADRLDLQVCAFAQEGILQAPGTEALLREALRAGADLVGGCPYNDTDGAAHVDRVFALAREFDCDADFHADFADEPVHRHVEVIADRTERHGWQGRVAIGHLTELAACDEAEQARVARRLHAAGIAVITLPATDLYLMGRRDIRNVRRGLTPVKRLLRRRRDGRGRDEQRPERLHARGQRGPAPPHVPPRRRRAHGRRDRHGGGARHGDDRAGADSRPAATTGSRSAAGPIWSCSTRSTLAEAVGGVPARVLVVKGGRVTSGGRRGCGRRATLTGAAVVP